MNKNFIAAMLLGIEGLLFFAFVLPKYNELGGVRDSLSQRQVLLTDTRAAEANIKNLMNQYQQNQFIVEQAVIALPEDRQYDYITESIQAAARDSGMTLSSLTLGEADKNPNARYKSLAWKAEILGNYNSFLAFLDALEHSLRLYDITKIDVATLGSSGGDNQLAITVNAKAYSLK